MLQVFRSYIGKVILLSVTGSLVILMTSCLKRPVLLPSQNSTSQADIIQEQQEEVPPPKLSSKIDTSLTVPATKKRTFKTRGSPHKFHIC